MNYIGLDIHKKNTQACVKNDEGKVLMNVRFPSNSKDINEFLDKIEPLGAASIVMEATGFCMYIYDILEARGHDVKVAHPLKVKALTAGRAKTDRNDAEMLAELLRLNAIPESYIPPKELRELRELTRFRQSLVRNSACIKNQIHAILAMRGVKTPPPLRSHFSKKHVKWLRSLGIVQLNDFLDIMAFIDTKIAKADEEIERICHDDEDVQRLKTIPGVGDITATSFVAEIGDIARFTSSEKLASYAGLTPIVRQSGEKEWAGPISKRGNATLRYLLIEAAYSHVNCTKDSKLTRFFEMKSQAKGRKKAIVATARKMLDIIFYMQKRGEAYHAH
jgi:transposase